MAGAITFPMVARDKARVRTQMSAGLTREDLDEVLRIIENVGKNLGLIWGDWMVETSTLSDNQIDAMMKKFILCRLSRR